MINKDNPRRSPPQSLAELRVRAEALESRSVAEVVKALGVSLPEDAKKAKGYVGQLAEAALGADPRAFDGPDFPALGVELKTIPLRPDGTPAESTFCCSITMETADRQRWESSRLRRRLQCVLWLPVEASSVAALPDRRFGKCVLWQPSESELALLEADWHDLIGAIGAGAGPSAHEGKVLQVRPKAASSRERVVAPSESGVKPALPLGFYLRTSFTRRILDGRSFDG